MLLAAEEISGMPTPRNVFPSVTVSDSTDAEIAETIGHDRNDFMLTDEMLAGMLGERANGVLLISDENAT